MAEVVRMPKLSDTMTDGVVAEWHKKVGDSVSAGEVLAEIETDKATMEFESFIEGTLLHIGVEKGAGAPVDSVLAILGEKGEDIAAILKAEASAPAPAKEVKKKAPKAVVASAAPVSITSAPKKEVKKVVTAPVLVESIDDDSMKASPLARKLAEEKGINMSMVRGSGEGGRIVKRDIDAFKGPQVLGIEGYYEEPASQMRKVIARRLSESKFSAPHFYLTMEIDMDAVMEARKSINTISATKISFNDLVIKAVAEGIRKNPKVNASWQGESIRYNEHIHVGVAVAVDEGLVVPVVRFADGKTLGQLSAEVKDYAIRAKGKKLQPQEMEGNTFTISNLGMFGIESFTSIINSPEACILSVGAIKQVPVVKNGQIVPGNTMKVTLACDHRAVDGAIGSAFLQTFKQLMENPVLLLGSYSI